jgi:nitroreductase/dihydropteridine reductase
MNRLDALRKIKKLGIQNMARLENNKYTIEEAFRECFYIVPDYQREYVWTEKQITQLLEDIDEQMDRSSSEYFIGNILVSSQAGERNHFELIVVTNPEVRSKICAAASNQEQINDGSHLLVFAAWDNYTDQRIDDVTALMTQERGEIEMMNAYYDNLKSAYVPRDAEVNYAHAARQAYIALGIAMVAAAEQEVDSTPMEGFDPEAVDEILGLKARGLRSVVLLPLGYRDPTGDWLLPMKKVRKSQDTLVSLVD